MQCLQQLGWSIAETFNKTVYTSNDGIRFELPSNKKVWEYDIKYKQMLRILSFYFNIPQNSVEDLIVGADEHVNTGLLVENIKAAVIPYKGLRVYHGQSLFYNSVSIVNYYLDKDNFLVIETMNFLKSNFKLERLGTRVKYETRSVYDNDKNYKITSLCDSLDQAVKSLNSLYFSKFENKQNPADYDYFRQSTVLKEILPSELIHVFGQTISSDIAFASKNAGFKEFQRSLETNVKYGVEIIQ